MFGIDVQELMNTTRDLCEQMDISFDDFDNFLARRRTSDPLPVKISTHLSHVTESTVIMALLQTFQGEVAATKELASFGPLFELSLGVKSER